MTSVWLRSCLNGKCTKNLCGNRSGVVVPKRMKRCVHHLVDRTPLSQFVAVVCTLIDVAGVQWMESATGL
jgi:hypothetical protein